MKWELTPEYLEDLLVRMAHHSTAIEGNSLTLGDTRTIIVANRIPHAMEMREFYEVRNYKELQIFFEKKVDSPIEISDIQEINRILLRDIDSRGGRFKVIPNIVLGADFIPTPPYKVLEELKKWVDDLQWRMENTHSEKEKTLAIMDQHLRFEHIHPFADGNGRTGRALMIWSCLGNQIVPIVIEKEQREDYIRALNDKNIPTLLKMAEEIQAKEKERMEIFQHSEELSPADQKELETLAEEIRKIHKRYRQNQKLEESFNSIMDMIDSCKDQRTLFLLRDRKTDYQNQSILHDKKMKARDDWSR